MTAEERLLLAATQIYLRCHAGVIFADLGRLLQFVVDFGADPGVGRRVEQLLVGQLGGLPVAQPLRLRDPFAQHDGRELAEALLLDSPVGGDGLQVNEAAVAEVAQLAQRAEVARHVGPHLADLRIAQQLEQRGGQRNPVEAEEVAALGGGELEQRDAEGHSLAERGARLGVESDDGMGCQICAGFGNLLLPLDDADFALIFDGRQRRGLFVADFGLECIRLLHRTINSYKVTEINRNIGNCGPEIGAAFRAGLAAGLAAGR